MKELRAYIVIILSGILFCQCANRLSLLGGEKDIEPPILNMEDSDPNFQINFEDKEFELSFNEFVKTNKPNEQIVISPPLQYNLTPVVRGKKIIFRFNEDESLISNTTYNVQFGEAIQDITESNPVNNLRYVFSTGSVIDSMQVRVQVLDLNDNEPVLGALVMLYETLSDTVIRKGRPTYFSKTDSSGVAVVQNCRPGQFRVFALVDENRNYQFDLPDEKVGHIDTFIRSVHMTENVHKVFVYNEIDPPFQNNVFKMDSQLYAIVVSGEIDYLNWLTNDGMPIETFIDKDTLFVHTPLNNKYLILSSDYSDPDTIKLDKIKLRKSIVNRFNAIKSPRIKAQLKNNKIFVEATWQNPIAAFDESKMRVFNQEMDLNMPLELNVESISDDGLKTKFSWKHEDGRDTLVLLPGAANTWYVPNDTMLLPLKPLNAENLSNLIVKTTELDSSLTYVLNLRSSSGELLNTTVIKDKNEDEWTVPGLYPAKHELELITDYNTNGKRDGGWFDKRQFPEPMNSIEIDNLRPDWDVQVDITPIKQNGLLTEEKLNKK